MAVRLLTPFYPHFRASSVLEVTPGFLEGRGIRGLVLDLDNTLVLWHAEEAAPEIAGWIETMHSASVGLCLLSNTHRPRRLRRVAERYRLRYVPSGGKPLQRGFRRALELLGAGPAETAMIGDQMMTDILGGNRCGLTTILVDRMSPYEFWGTRAFHRPLERLLLRNEPQGLSRISANDEAPALPWELKR
jgi:HAD superfamily phosphatase (TIGR01668 family)